MLTSLSTILLGLFLVQIARAMFLRSRGYPAGDTIVLSLVWLLGALAILLQKAVTL